MPGIHLSFLSLNVKRGCDKTIINIMYNIELEKGKIKKMNEAIMVKPGSVEAYQNTSNDLYIKRQLDSEGQYTYKISVVKSYWSYVEHFFKSLFTCCSTETSYFYGLNARKIIDANASLKRALWPIPETFCGFTLDVFPKFFLYLDARAFQSASCVSKGWNKLMHGEWEHTKLKNQAIAFGKEKWESHFKININTEPMVPLSLFACLEEPDPWDSDKKVKETHAFILSPKGVSVPILENHLQDQLCHDAGIDSSINESSEWILVRTTPLPGRTGYTFEEQKEWVEGFADRGYSIPTSLEVVICMLIYKAKSGKNMLDTMDVRCIDQNNDDHYGVLCKSAQLIVGIHPTGKICVSGRMHTHLTDSCGITVVRKFKL